MFDILSLSEIDAIICIKGVPFVAARRWGELLSVRLPEDHRPYIRIPDPHNVLRRWNHLQAISVSDQEVGRWRGRRPEALG